ncbi:hypothetical protein BOTBODRAFT_191580 [Botryobasidium botryosum FD-172 SS1]|uniref:Uncharacterized protein n=1 Tax=Botryobasidium botryosum (strain FD-172 SS1) TaxID=930990 RepID=A0A067LZI8_BOTB1|nr:hypothetical protein BOTBODRAFT_191580 [Botryobasidium botryosum FD-172 SS1]
MGFDESLREWRGRHIAYWQERGGSGYEWDRYTDGFTKGWRDAANGKPRLPKLSRENNLKYLFFLAGQCGNEQAKNQSRAEHLVAHGPSDHLWQFDHGYSEAITAFQEQ